MPCNLFQALKHLSLPSITIQIDYPPQYNSPESGKEEPRADSIPEDTHCSILGWKQLCSLDFKIYKKKKKMHFTYTMNCTQILPPHLTAIASYKSCIIHIISVIKMELFLSLLSNHTCSFTANIDLQKLKCLCAARHTVQAGWDWTGSTSGRDVTWEHAEAFRKAYPYHPAGTRWDQPQLCSLICCNVVLQNLLITDCRWRLLSQGNRFLGNKQQCKNPSENEEYELCYNEKSNFLLISRKLSILASRAVQVPD